MLDITLNDKPKTGTVYGLIASDEPLQVRYVGKTVGTPFARLKGHCTSKGPSSWRTRNWIKEVMQRGAEVRLRILGEYPIADLEAAELRWIRFWATYCESLNATGIPFVKQLRQLRQRTRHSYAVAA